LLLRPAMQLAAHQGMCPQRPMCNTHSLAKEARAEEAEAAQLRPDGGGGQLLHHGATWGLPVASPAVLLLDACYWTLRLAAPPAAAGRLRWVSPERVCGPRMPWNAFLGENRPVTAFSKANPAILKTGMVQTLRFRRPLYRSCQHETLHTCRAAAAGRTLTSDRPLCSTAGWVTWFALEMAVTVCC
jgi:hypothetical protein